MHQLDGKIWTYTSARQESQRLLARKIRYKDSGDHIVQDFEDLTTKVAKLGFLNKKWFLLFRGQSTDFHTRSGKIALYPLIYRAEPGKTVLRGPVREDRFDTLARKVQQLRDGYPGRTRQYVKELRGLKVHHELCWAILRHYEIVPTPYLDMTSSLRVAASFALRNSQCGHVYVFAFPYPSGSITHVVDEDIKMVRLQAACPPSAKRPHFQEGYLAGSCYVDPGENRANQNAARRLLAKFYIPDATAFWQEGQFDAIPEDALFPTSDKSFE